MNVNEIPDRIKTIEERSKIAHDHPIVKLIEYGLQMCTQCERRWVCIHELLEDWELTEDKIISGLLLHFNKRCPEVAKWEEH